MKIIRRISVVALVLASFLVVAASVGVSQTPESDTSAEPNVPHGRQFTPPWYVASPEVPPDVVLDPPLAPDLPITDFAWNTFIALSWPASSREYGVPDRQNLVGGFPYSKGIAPPGQPSGPTVWETFKDTKDIYLNPPDRPAPFDAPESIPAACKGLALENAEAARRTMAMVTKTSEVLRDVRQAFTMAPLIDLNGELVRYEVKVNETYYDFVVANGYYDSRNQPAGGVNFPEGANDKNGLGAIRVKAAWKVMSKPGAKFHDDPKRFYTTQALIYDETTKTCSKQLMGLVGLHIAQKTAVFPRYIWATFEHVDNAPTPDEIESGAAAKKKWNFYNPASNAKWNAPPPNDPAKWTVPVQVVRLLPVTDNAALVNPKFRKMLYALNPGGATTPGNVWANYFLVGAQWSSAEMSPIPNQPDYMANTTMETYLQEPIDDPNSPHGCINCHNKFVPTTDGDFQMKQAWPHAPKEAQALFEKSMALPGPR
jgi:hypothetical protein